MCPNRDNFSTATNDRKRKKALPSYVYISLSRFRMFPVAKLLSTSLLCMLTDGIMCSIMPALSFSLSLSLFLILWVWEGVSFRNLLKKEPTHAIAQLKSYPLFFKVVLPAIWCVSPPSVNSMCVFLVPSITLPMLWNMIMNTKTLLTLPAFFCSSRSFSLILSVHSLLLLFWEEGEREGPPEIKKFCPPSGFRPSVVSACTLLKACV